VQRPNKDWTLSMTKEITVPEDHIRERAYLISEEAGHPHGCCDEFWHRARSELHAAAMAVLAIKARKSSSPKAARPAAAEPVGHPVRRGSKAKTAAPMPAKSTKTGSHPVKSAKKASAKKPSLQKPSGTSSKVRGSAKAR
jgi:hypothetical protein